MHVSTLTRKQQFHDPRLVLWATVIFVGSLGSGVSQREEEDGNKGQVGMTVQGNRELRRDRVQLLGSIAACGSSASPLTAQHGSSDGKVP